jgi:hypothetical protein
VSEKVEADQGRRIEDEHKLTVLDHDMPSTVGDASATRHALPGLVVVINTIRAISAVVAETDAVLVAKNRFL